MGIWPDSMLAQTSIFPQANAIGMNNYQLALVFKCVEGGFEAGPQLVIQTWSIFLDQSTGMYNRYFCYKLWPILLTNGLLVFRYISDHSISGKLNDSCSNQQGAVLSKKRL